MKKKLPPKPPGLNVSSGKQPKADKSWYQPYWPGSDQNMNRKDSGKNNSKRKQ